MHPGKNDYPVEQQVSNEVAIRSDWLTGEDLFLITEQVNGTGRSTSRRSSTRSST